MPYVTRAIRVRALGVAVAAVATLGARSAGADSTGAFLDDIPNGNFVSCRGCHTDDVGPDLNPFGQAINGTLDAPVDAGGVPSWAEVRGLDSDGDGQTNGQELGDPCGSWQVGQLAPRASWSYPGLASSVSAEPNEPSCSPDDGGGCAVVGSAAGLTGAAVALILLTLALPVRRRRCRRRS